MTSRFTLKRDAEVNVKPPEAGLEKPIPGGNERWVIVAIPVQDGRQSASRCGIQKGGYGNETAQAVCQGNPTQWIAEFLVRELKASGFAVLPSEQGARDSALKVEGVLRKVFVEPVVGFWSTTVESDLNVKLVATSKTERGSRDLLTKMVEAILELMKRYPELGFDRRDGRMLVSFMLETER